MFYAGRFVHRSDAAIERVSHTGKVCALLVFSVTTGETFNCHFMSSDKLQVTVRDVRGLDTKTASKQ